MQEPDKHKTRFYERYVKRFFDVLVSFAGLILFAPVALLCALAIKLDDPSGSILFKQERNGKNGKVFGIAKFRTMKRELSGGAIVAHKDTLTGVGKVLRKLSLDEYPQLVNILRGEMSLIGPRPLLLSYYEWFNQTERRRFEVRPGLTGLSQINGRVNLNWDQRFMMDVEYVDNLSFWLDLKIFIRTFAVVFSHKDAISEGGMENFDVYRKKQLEQERTIEVRKRVPSENVQVFRSRSMGA